MMYVIRNIATGTIVSTKPQARAEAVAQALKMLRPDRSMGRNELVAYPANWESLTEGAIYVGVATSLEAAQLPEDLDFYDFRIEEELAV